MKVKRLNSLRLSPLQISAGTWLLSWPAPACLFGGWIFNLTLNEGYWWENNWWTCWQRLGLVQQLETGYFSTIVNTFSWAGTVENSGEGKKKKKVEKGSNSNNIIPSQMEV